MDGSWLRLNICFGLHNSCNQGSDPTCSAGALEAVDSAWLYRPCYVFESSACEQFCISAFLLALAAFLLAQQSSSQYIPRGASFFTSGN